MSAVYDHVRSRTADEDSRDLSFAWDQWRYTDYFLFEEDTSAAPFENLSDLACRGLVIAVAEAITARFHAHRGTEEARSYLDAAWATMLREGACDYALPARRGLAGAGAWRPPGRHARRQRHAPRGARRWRLPRPLRLDPAARAPRPAAAPSTRVRSLGRRRHLAPRAPLAGARAPERPLRRELRPRPAGRALHLPAARSRHPRERRGLPRPPSRDPRRQPLALAPDTA